MKPNENREPLIELEEITLAYNKKVILEKIYLKIEPGEFICLVGKSGIGKSTLLYTLGGFLRPLSGIYRFEGKRVFRLGEMGLGRFRKKNIGYLFQDFRLLPFLTIEQNISFPIFFTGEKFSKDQLSQLMKDFGIYHRKNAYPRDISGGEAQRTALARALLMRPKALLLDEPTGNLDSATEAEILKQLLKLREHGLTLICVTHSRPFMEVCDRVIRLENGSLTEGSPPFERRTERLSEGAISGSPAKADAPKTSAKAKTAPASKTKSGGSEKNAKAKTTPASKAKSGGSEKNAKAKTTPASKTKSGGSEKNAKAKTTPASKTKSGGSEKNAKAKTAPASNPKTGSKSSKRGVKK